MQTENTPVRRLPLGLISSLILALGLAICPARPAGAQHPLALSGAERQARPDLAKLEDSARELLAKVQAQDQSLAMALAETSTIAAQGAPSRKDPNLAGKYLQEELLPELWTLSVSIKAGQGAATTPWDQADRRQTWLATAYRAAIQELSPTGRPASPAHRSF